MKKTLVVILLTIMYTNSFAQNEGRIGLYSGISKTTLLNADDLAFGDYLPTYKPSTGIEAGYHFTLFHALPMGISFQCGNSKSGQDYRGFYADSTSYYAYTRLNYVRTGLALHFGTNPRRAVSLDMSVGANIGFLTNYQEKYELIRYNNDRLILNIKNNEVYKYDTYEQKGSLTSPLYNKIDKAVFGTMGLNFLFSKSWAFGFYARVDYGLTDIENKIKRNINYNTVPSSSEQYKIFNTEVKYHGPTSDLVVHGPTNNVGIGIFLSLKYRIFNKEKVEFYYKENRNYNHQ